MTIKRNLILTEREALSGPPTRQWQPEARLAGARRPLPDADADALRQVGSAEFAKAKSLVANVVNDEDDLSERS